MLQCRSVLDFKTALRVSQETFYANRYGIEIRYPYRDRRLAEYMLAVPSHQLYNRGRFKHILRNALDGLLPDEVSQRIEQSSLMPLSRRGLVERERSTVQRYLHESHALWTRFIRPEALEQAGQQPDDGPEKLITWWSIAAGIWQEKRDMRLPTTAIR